MGFYLKKVISFWIEPFGLLLLLLLVSLFFLFKNRLRWAKISMGLFFVLFILFSYPPFSNFLVENLENRYEKYDYDKKDIRYIHVLGNGNNTDSTQPISSKLNDAGIKRVIEGVVIYKKTPNSKLIFTGHGPCHGTPNAVMNSMLAIELGVKKEDIIINIEPTDTRDEADFMKTILSDGEEFILVTSASHMYRSMILFKSLGLNPLAAPTDFKKYDFKTYIKALSINSIETSQIAIHEYIGILWAKITT